MDWFLYDTELRHKKLKNSVSRNKTCKVSVKLETSVTLLIDFLVNVSAGSLHRLK